MSHEWDQYRSRFASHRPETFDALVDVWLRIPEAQSEFTGWASFSQAALAEPAQRRDHPGRVERAEQLMGRGGHEIGEATPRGARRWVRRTSQPS